MALHILAFDLFPGDDGAEIRQVLEDAGKKCAPEGEWTVTAYEGPDLGGTTFVLQGKTRALIWTPWHVESPGRYSMLVMRDGEQWKDEVKRAVGLMIS
jgi:hypothetical protein